MNDRVYVFDAYGTLFDVHGAVARYAYDIGPQADALSQTWRVKQLEYSWTYGLMGRYRDFRDLTGAALDVAAATHGALPDGLRAKLLAAYEDLDAYADVAPALRKLRDGGFRTAILSNGCADMLGNATRAAGLTDLLDAILTVDDVKTFKTAPAVYELVGQRFGVEPGDVRLHSSNRWDVAGARAFGFQTCWVNRTGKPDEYLDLPPHAVIASLDEIVP